MHAVRIPVLDAGVVGTLFRPGSGVAGTVVCLGGSDGGVPEATAARLAESGYAALALAYFGAVDLPQELTRVPLEYFRGALQWLQERFEVGPTALLGASKGAEAALLTAAAFPSLVGPVVTWWPTPLVWQSMTLGDAAQLMRGISSSWTLDGRELPCASLPAPMPSDFMDVQWTRWPWGNIPVPQPHFRQPSARMSHERAASFAGERARIPVERIEGRLLLFSGSEDRVWPSDRFAEQIVERRRRLRPELVTEHVCYEGAGHLGGLPHSTPITSGAGPLLHGGSMGGSLEANGAMMADSWERALAWLSADEPASEESRDTT